MLVPLEPLDPLAGVIVGLGVLDPEPLELLVEPEPVELELVLCEAELDELDDELDGLETAANGFGSEPL